MATTERQSVFLCLRAHFGILVAYFMTARCIAKLRPAIERAELFGGD